VTSLACISQRGQRSNSGVPNRPGAWHYPSRNYLGWLYLGGVWEAPRAAQSRAGIVRHTAVFRSPSIIAASFEDRLRAELHAAADQIEPARGLPELRARILATRPGAPMIADPEMTFHRCPARACREQVPDKFLMDAPHWAMVPGPYQRAVYQALRDHGIGSAMLRAAHRAAIDAVNNRLEEADA
jgi:hypothetical protein